MTDNHIEPTEVIQLVEHYVDRELRDAEQYTNRTPLDESGVWSLHQLARDVYARGVQDGVRQEGERARRDRVRETEKRKATEETR